MSGELQDIDLLATLDLCAALKTFLAAIDHPTLSGEKLFEDVEFYPEKNLADALQQLVIAKQRICLIVPSGDHHTQAKEGRGVRTTVWANLDLVIADRAYLQKGQEAVFGGAKNVGVLAMKDLVMKALGANPQLTIPSAPTVAGLRWCALYPTAGAIIALSDAEERKAPGRQAFVLSYQTPAGQIITPLTVPWPN